MGSRSARLSVSSRQVGHLPRRASKLEDMHPGIGAVDDIDVAAVVYFDVVGLDRDLAALPAGAAVDAALVGLVGDGRNVKADFLRVEGIADVDRAHAGVEVRE